MRVFEILNEDGDSTAGQGRKEKKGASGKVHDHFQSAIKGMETYPDNSYYEMYRFGVDMAKGPDDQPNYDKAGAIGNQLVTIAYTDSDQKIIDKSKKNMKFRSQKLTSKDSSEHPDTHTSSPVAKIKRNKYGV